MDICKLPYNQMIGLESADGDSDFLVKLSDDPKYGNHLGTVHASALFAVAEAGSGAFLVQQFGEGSGFVPVVRRVEVKFRKPASGRVAARCVVAPEAIARWSDELESRGRVIAAVPMEVLDEGGTVALSGVVEWFISKASSDS